MRTLVAVARREIVDKKFVIWAALVAAVVPFAVPALLQLRGGRAQDVRDATAIILGLSISGAVAAGMGSSIFAGELLARRMSFFFSRPISSASIWAGKLGAAALVVAVPFLLILGPAALVDQGLLAPVTGEAVAAAVLALLTILLLVNHISTMIRSRSWVGIVDLAAAIVIGAVIGMAWTSVQRWNFVPSKSFAWMVALAALAGLLWSSYRAVARGRTSVRASHGALSASLWSVFGALAAALVGYGAWVLAAPPSSLGNYVSTAVIGPRGWVFFSGWARHAQASFLYDTVSGAYERIPSDSVVVSGDGRTAAWAERSREGLWELHTRRLDAAARSETTRVSFRPWPYPLLLSPDATAVATVEEGVLTASDVRTGRILASARIGAGAGWRSGTFLSGSRILILRQAIPPNGVESIELDLVTRTTKASKTEGRNDSFVVPSFDRKSNRVILRDVSCRHVSIHDGETLAHIANVREDQPARCSARWMADGSIVLALSREDGSWIDWHSADGKLLKRIPIGSFGTIRVGSQAADGRLLLSFETASSEPNPKTTTELLLVDLPGGKVSRVGRDLVPLWYWWWDPFLLTPPGSEPALLFVDAQNHGLVRFDPATGNRKVLLKGS